MKKIIWIYGPDSPDKTELLNKLKKGYDNVVYLNFDEIDMMDKDPGYSSRWIELRCIYCQTIIVESKYIPSARWINEVILIDMSLNKPTII